MFELVSEATKWVNKQLERISLVKERILVFAGLIYFIGYAVWSFNSWVNNLGLLPALQLQYFVAGAVPVIVLATVGGIWSIGNWFLQKKWPMLVGPGVTGWKKGLRLGVQMLFLISLGMFILSAFLPEIVMIVVGYAFICTALLLPPDSLRHVKGFRILNHFHRIIIFGLLPLAVAIAGLLYFFRDVYPILPQEFGGVRPRCAYLDIEKDTLSTETLAAILPSNLIISGDPFARSLQVDVYFSGGSTFLVKPHLDHGEKTLTTYEINRSNIKVITWCVGDEK